MRPTITLLFISLILSLPIAAQEKATIALAVNEDFFAKLCPTPLWKALPAVWKGIRDERSSPEVGIQQRKKETVTLLAEPPLDKAFDEAARRLFSTCGLNFESKGKSPLSVAGVIEQFHADVQKNRFTGKGTARSRLVFTVEKFDPSKMSLKEITVQVGYETETKGFRKKKLRQLEESLQELFAKTLEQIPTAKELREISSL